MKIVILAKPVNEEQTKLPKYLAHFPLDILITEKEEFLPKFAIDFLKNNSKIVIRAEDCVDQDIVEHNFDVSPGDSCLCCTSSGSTSDPKLIEHTHEFFYSLCSINWESLEFNDEDHIVHITSFQHGSALGIYFLPSLYKSKNHYFHMGIDPSSKENGDNFVKYCAENKITKMKSAYAADTDWLISALKRSKEGLPNLTIYVLSYINPEWLSIIKEGKLKKIISIFGCSEASGPLFLSHIDTNTENFDPRFLGNPIKGFHKTSIDTNGELTINIPIYDKTIKTEDFFEKNKNGYRFVSKNKLYRLGDIEINTKDLQKIFQDNFDKIIIDDVLIIVDEIYSKLYAITTNREILFKIDQIKKDIETLYDRRVILNNCFYLKDLKDFVIGIKPDREKLLEYIRQMEIRN